MSTAHPTARRLGRLVMIAAVAALAMACDDDSEAPLAPQPTASDAPATVTDLRSPVITGASVDLRWTAPSDDGASGTATAYEIRYADVALSESNWSSATPVASPPPPQAAGNRESLRVSGLAPLTSYYFGVKAIDDEGNVSALSNIVAATTHGTVNYYVDARNGDDSFPGSLAEPLKTITRGLALATDGDSIRVLPGLYDAANGEIFPLTVPAGVAVFGDEANRGAGEDSTSVVGGEVVGGTNYSVVLRPFERTLIAGFWITNVDTTSTTSHNGIAIGLGGGASSNDIIVRRNTLIGNGGAGIAIVASSGHRVIDNEFTGNNRGLSFNSGGGTNTVVELNRVTGNNYGVEVAGQSLSPDLGGGAAGSAGGNVLACNAYFDVFVVDADNLNVSARFNYWDHAPPTIGTFNGDDIAIINSANAIVDTTGEQLATPACP